MRGYSRRYNDEMSVAVITGYYCGYYTNAKRAKSPKDILKELYSKTKKKQTGEDMSVAVGQFLQREQKFKEILGGGTIGGESKT